MPSFTITSDSLISGPTSFTITSDAVISPPATITITSDALIVPPTTTIIRSDAFIVPATSVTLTSDAVMEADPGTSFVGGAGSGDQCVPYQEPLVSGVDYELDAANGRIRFLSSGRLGGAGYSAYGICGATVSFCCQDSGCVYVEDAEHSCMGACYIKDGYDTVFQEGAENYRNDEEKMLKRATVEAEPLPASTPAPLECDVAFGNQPSCMTWKAVRPLEFECQTEKSAAQHAADRTRPDDGFHFPTWVRGKYLSVRWRVTGIGGGGMFSALHKLIKGWGQHDAP
jgi:hypothetical protein